MLSVGFDRDSSNQVAAERCRGPHGRRHRQIYVSVIIECCCDVNPNSSAIHDLGYLKTATCVMSFQPPSGAQRFENTKRT
jgi:hypothetical protein